MLRLYIAGPMSNIPGFNFRAFDRVRTMLDEKLGVIGVSPADGDRLIWPEHYFDDTNSLPPGFSAAQQMKLDLILIDYCDGVFMMNGWENSSGSAVEIAYAKFCKKLIFYENDLDALKAHLTPSRAPSVDTPADTSPEAEPRPRA